MPANKIQADLQTKALSVTTTDSQSALPKKRDEPMRPAMLQGAGEMLAPPDANLSAPIRARMATMVQRTVGNDRLGRISDTEKSLRQRPRAADGSLGGGVTVIQRQAAPDQPVPVGHEHRRRSRRSQRRRSEGREHQTAPAQAPTAQVDQAIVDQVIGESIRQTLRSFQHIPIQVGTEMNQHLTAGMTPKTVYIQAAYFIRTDRAQEQYREPRDRADFDAIVNALEQQRIVSFIETGNEPRRYAGRAVEVGKGTPKEIALFIEEAIRQGAVYEYALARGEINRARRLVELPESRLQTLIQNWVYYVGIGVDCSGFVQQAAIQAREAERRERLRQGMREEQLPPQVSHTERGSAGFESIRRRITSPEHLRPGHVWVIPPPDRAPSESPAEERRPGHIRIVSAVRHVILDSGREAIEFDTAESSGTSSQPLPGPIDRTWRTSSTANFRHITSVPPNTAAPRGDQFYEVQR